MPTLIEDLELVGVVMSDLAAFAGGSPVNASPTIDGQKLNISLVHLPNGPAAPYQVISGSILVLLGTALTLGAEYAAGVPVSVAAKEGNTWYGLTLQKAA